MHFTHELFLFSTMSDKEMELFPSLSVQLELLSHTQIANDRLSLPDITPYQHLLKQNLFQTEAEATKTAKEWMLWFYRTYPDQPFQVSLTHSHTRSVIAWAESAIRHEDGRVIIPSMETYNQKMRQNIGATYDVIIKHTYDPPKQSATNAIVRCFVSFPGVVLANSPYDMINKKLKLSKEGSAWISEVSRGKLTEVGNLTLAKEIAFRQIIPQNKEIYKKKL